MTLDLQCLDRIFNKRSPIHGTGRRWRTCDATDGPTGMCCKRNGRCHLSRRRVDGTSAVSCECDRGSRLPSADDHRREFLSAVSDFDGCLVRRVRVYVVMVMAAALIADVSIVGEPTGGTHRHREQTSPHWEQTFADDFSTPVVRGEFANSGYRSRWLSYDGFADTSGKGRYDAGVIAVRDGALDMYLHTEGDQPLSAAVVAMVDGRWRGQLYGRWDVRFRGDELPGYKMAFLLWPDSNNWGEGEIDFPEAAGLDSGTTMYANIYAKGDTRSRKPGLSSGFTTNTVPVGSGWHSATIEWSPDRVTFILDNAPVGTTIADGVPDTPMHWVLQIETAIDGAKPAADVAGHIQIDWVRIYSYHK